MDIEKLIEQAVSKVLTAKLGEFKQDILKELKSKKMELNYLTVEETARALKVDESTVRRYMNNGELHYVQPNHIKLTTSEWIQDYLNKKNNKLPIL